MNQILLLIQVSLSSEQSSSYQLNMADEDVAHLTKQVDKSQQKVSLAYLISDLIDKRRDTEQLF